MVSTALDLAYRLLPTDRHDLFAPCAISAAGHRVRRPPPLRGRQGCPPPTAAKRDAWVNGCEARTSSRSAGGRRLQYRRGG